jgi:hypothetical protein
MWDSRCKLVCQVVDFRGRQGVAFDPTGFSRVTDGVKAVENILQLLSRCQTVLDLQRVEFNKDGEKSGDHLQVNSPGSN